MKNERQDIIIGRLQENRMVKSNELKEMFNVSMETIRRDLEELEEEGYLTRVYGGATIKRMYGIEPGYEGRGIKNFHEKQLIGKAAAELVEDGDTIIIDVGTTTLEFAKNLHNVQNLTALTNSIPIIIELKKHTNIRAFMIGGEVREGELSSAGFLAEEMIDRFNVDKVFIGIGGITLDKGICDYHLEEANLRKHFIANSQKRIGLVDYSKFGITALNKVCALKDLDCIITDSKADPKMINEIKNLGVTIDIVGN